MATIIPIDCDPCILLGSSEKTNRRKYETMNRVQRNVYVTSMNLLYLCICSFCSGNFFLFVMYAIAFVLSIENVIDDEEEREDLASSGFDD